MISRDQHGMCNDSCCDAFSRILHFSVPIGCTNSKQFSGPERLTFDPSRIRPTSSLSSENGRSLTSHRSGSLSVVRRLAAELADIKAGDDPFNITPDADSMTQWSAVIEGPDSTPFKGGRFVIDMFFPIDYPFLPPRVSFRTPIFHPNISSTGAVCLDILKGESGAWSPLITVPDLLRSIQSLLSDPNPDDPLNIEAADLFSNKRHKFNARAAAETQRFAHGNAQQSSYEVGEDPYSHLQVSRTGEVLNESSAIKAINKGDQKAIR